MPGIDRYTSLMLHCDGSSGSTTFIDSSSNAQAMTAAGAAQIDTTQKEFGTGSMLLDGSSSWVTSASATNFNFGSASFTIDFWGRFASLASLNQVFFAQRGSSSFGCQIRITSSTNYRFAYSSDGTTTTTIDFTAPTALDSSTWFHFALVRNGSNLNCYTNGTGSSGASFTSTIFASTAVFAVGSANAAGATGSVDFNGNVDEFRVSVGSARWTANFTPPQQPYDTALGFDNSFTPEVRVISPLVEMVPY